VSAPARAFTWSLPAIGASVLAIFALFRLVRVSSACRKGKIFVERNAQDLAAAAWLILSVGLVQFVATIIPDVTAGRFPFSQIGTISLYSFIVLIGLVLFLFAHAVAEGAKLADEASHTV
jgi:hypothetical protein